MFKHAIARTPCQQLVNGLTSADLGKPIYSKALEQHSEYMRSLEKCGLTVTLLPADERFPDSVFVEDTVLCTKHCAILTRPGALTRRNEVDIIADTIKNHYQNVERIEAPGTLDAGDIMMVAEHFYIGLSARTNAAGAQQLIAILEKYNMTGSVVHLNDVLHLKTGVAYLENNNLLASGEFVTHPDFKKFNIIEVPEYEAYAANCIWINGHVVMPAGYHYMREKVSELGYGVIEVDTSEFRKVDGGVSCMSLRF